MQGAQDQSSRQICKSPNQSGPCRIINIGQLTISSVAVAEVDDVVDGAVDDLKQVVDAYEDGEPLNNEKETFVSESSGPQALT